MFAPVIRLQYSSQWNLKAPWSNHYERNQETVATLHQLGHLVREKDEYELYMCWGGMGGVGGGFWFVRRNA